MDKSNTMLGSYLALGVVVAGAAGYASAWAVHRPGIVEVSSTACGVPPSTASFGVPLQMVMRADGNLPFSLGPVELARMGLISLRFDPTVAGQGREVRIVGDILHLPTAFGLHQVAPRRIMLNCRDGVIGSVRYQGDGRDSATFHVVREAERPRGGRSPPGHNRRINTGDLVFLF
jgi:hypothetical protein